MKRGRRAGGVRNFLIYLVFAIFVAVSYKFNYHPGKQIGANFAKFLLNMMKILPPAFVLIGLFEVWVRKEAVERHLGAGSGVKGYLSAIMLAGTIIGGPYVAFPVACSLYNKGARLAVIFTYVSAASICRVPMTIFEASFMGLKFTLIRYLVSLPLVVMSGKILESYLMKAGMG